MKRLALIAVLLAPHWAFANTYTSETEAYVLTVETTGTLAGYGGIGADFGDDPYKALIPYTKADGATGEYLAEVSPYYQLYSGATLYLSLVAKPGWEIEQLSNNGLGGYMGGHDGAPKFFADQSVTLGGNVSSNVAVTNNAVSSTDAYSTQAPDCGAWAHFGCTGPEYNTWRGFGYSYGVDNRLVNGVWSPSGVTSVMVTGTYSISFDGLTDENIAQVWPMFAEHNQFTFLLGQVAAVPEPETYALMGLGLIGLVARSRRNKA